MTIIKEFRIPLPMSVEEFQVAQLYAVVQASREQTDGSTAVEILANEPYDDPVMGKGQYTHKIYHIGGKAPAIIRALAPSSALKVEERAWNAYPYCKTVLSNPFLGERFSIIVESIHLADKGDTANALKMDKDQLAKRQIQFIDIGNEALEPAEAKRFPTDPSIYRSQKAQRGPFKGNWQEEADPLMCCYKAVTIKCQIFGVQGRIEKLIDQTEASIFLSFFKKVVITMDEWFGLDMTDIRRMEEEVKRELDAKLDSLNLETRASTGKTDSCGSSSPATSSTSEQFYPAHSSEGNSSASASESSPKLV